MSRDDIIRMAREALLPSCHLTHPKALERFATLVAVAEREACARVCETEGIGAKYQGDVYAVAIRARGEK